MHPFIYGQWIGGRDRNGVSGPEMNQRPFQAPLLDQQLVAAARRIGPGPRTVQHDAALLNVRRVQPKRDGERFLPGEISQWQVDRIVSREFDGLAVFARGKPILAAQHGRLRWARWR